MALLGESAAENQLVAEPVEVPAGVLPDPVHVHLVTISHPGQLDARVPSPKAPLAVPPPGGGLSP